MRIVKALAAVSLATSLGACVTTAAEQEAGRIQSVRSAGEPAVAACNTRAAEAAKSQFGDKPTNMSNTLTPTLTERAQLREFQKDYLEPCRIGDSQYYGALHPQLGALKSEHNTAKDMNLAKLIRGEITWGRYAENAAQISATYQSAWVSTTSNINSGMQAAHRTEVQDRQAAWARVQNAAANWQMIEAANRPRTTSCMRTGTMLNCTTN